MSVPLIDFNGALHVPATWCVVACEQGCDESWSVDTTDFSPILTAADVERLLKPLLIAHEVEHGKFAFTPGSGIETQVYEAIGAASMCWDHPERAGVFHSERAREIGDALMEKIRDVLR